MQQTDYRTSLTAVLWPQTSLWQDGLLVLGGSLLIALLAQVAVPLWPVPVTGQTLGVLLVAAALGQRRGTLSVLAYLGQGALGLPVFAAGGAGLGQLLGPTGGYLAGFVVAAFVVGWLCERGWGRRWETAVFTFFLGSLLIYAVGLPWLATFVGWSNVLSIGLLPFIPGDILKVLLAAGLLPTAWRFLR